MSATTASAIAGSKWTMASQLVLLVSALTQTAILARILAPADFGMAAIAGILVGWLTIYSELGFSAAIVQKKNTSDDILSTLYILNISAAVICSVITLMAAPMLARLYGQPILQNLISCLAPAFILSAAGSQFRALNQKHLRFALMAKIEIAGALFSTLVGIAFAIKGFGAYSLVFAALANVSITSLLNFVTGLRYHRPGLAFAPGKIGEFLRFGLFQMGDNTLNYLNSQIDVLLVGKFSGAHSLGLYSTSKSIPMRPAGFINSIFNRVAFPIMSHSQNDQTALRHMFLSGLRLLCFINFLIYALLFVAAEPLIRILLGNSWIEAVPILQILSLYMLVRSTGNPVGSLLMATGRYRRSFVWNLVVFAIVPICIWLGSHQGITGIAWALLSLQILLIFPNWYFLVKPCCDAGFAEYFNVQIPALLAASGAVMAAWPAAHLSSNAWVNLIAAGLIGGLTYLLISLVINRKAITSARALI